MINSVYFGFVFCSLSLFVCLMHEDYLSVLWIYPVLLRGIKTLWSVNTIVCFSCYGYLALTTTTTTIWVFRYILWSVSVSLCMCVYMFECMCFFCFTWFSNNLQLLGFVCVCSKVCPHIYKLLCKGVCIYAVVYVRLALFVCVLAGFPTIFWVHMYGYIYVFTCCLYLLKYLKEF